MKVMISVFFSGLLLSSATHSQSELPVQSRPIDIYEIAEGYNIAFDNSPEWSYEYEPHPKAPAFNLFTPENYYPPAAVIVRFHKGQIITQGEDYFKDLAFGAIETSALNNGNEKIKMVDLQPATYRQLKGYSAIYSSGSGKDKLDNRIYMTRNSKGQLMSMTVTTLPGKLDHIEAATRRIFDNISFPENEAKPKKKQNSEK